MHLTLGWFVQSKDEEEFKQLRQEFQDGTMKQYWTWIEGMIQENGGCFISGDTPTFADLMVAQAVPAIDHWDHIDKNFFNDYPGVLATMKGIQNNEQVKGYYAAKQETKNSEL